MSVVSVKAKSFILALFIRDDGERFLLGDKGYDFMDSQLHFAANTIENDEVAKQGADGVLVAGQVRRASVQSFDGYIGDAGAAKDIIEQMRREFIAFFAKGHHFRVIYVDCNRDAWQRKGGYLVDAPEVKELWQIHPEYHVGINFEDVNYYEYDENAEGEEILSNLFPLPISSAVEGGLVWDEDGAVSEDAVVEYDVGVVGGGYVWEEGGSGGASILLNDSITSVWPVWTVKGPALNPQLENTTTGDSIQYVGMVSEGQTLTVDMGEQTASLDGLNVISNIAGDWVELAPGQNTLLYSADSADAPDSEIGWSEIVG